MENNNICPICLEEDNDNHNYKMITQCNHYFHKSCFYRANRDKDLIFCPYCKTLNNNTLTREKYNFIQINPIILKNIIFLSMLLFIFVNIKRVTTNYKNYYYNYPWPKIYSFSADNKVEKKIPVFNNEKIIYYISDAECMYGYSPCTGSNNKINYKEILNNLNNLQQITYISNDEKLYDNHKQYMKLNINELNIDDIL
jgi:hypothetical protein